MLLLLLSLLLLSLLLLQGVGKKVCFRAFVDKFQSSTVLLCLFLEFRSVTHPSILALCFSRHPVSLLSINFYQLQFLGKKASSWATSGIFGQNLPNLGNSCPKPSHMSFFYVCLCRPVVLIFLAYDRQAFCPRTTCQFKDMSNDNIESADVIIYVCCVGPWY